MSFFTTNDYKNQTVIRIKTCCSKVILISVFYCTGIEDQLIKKYSIFIIRISLFIKLYAFHIALYLMCTVLNACSKF